MIKRKFAAALVGLSVAMFGAASSAQAKELVVATDTAFVPFEFKQGNTYTGFDVDLWAATLAELKLQYKLQPMDFNGIIPGLQTKNIDVALAGITIRDDRKKVIDSPIPTTKAAWPSWSATRTPTSRTPSPCPARPSPSRPAPPRWTS